MIKKCFKIFFRIVLFLGLMLGLEQLIELKTHGFCLQRIQARDLPFHAEWETPPLSQNNRENIERLLSQSYTFLGAGSECFAFVSEDGSTVIKFFKLDFMRPVYLHRGILIEDYSNYAGSLSNHPLTKRKEGSPFYHEIKRVLGMREYRLLRTFTSIKLAYEHLKEETGLIYLHLNPTDHLRKTLTLYDACGIAHPIDLDSSKFFLQKKAIPMETHLTTLKEEDKDEEARQCIDSLIALILTRCGKGFADRDIVDRNLGFIGTKAIEIDSGSFLKSPHMKQPWIYKQELFYATLELKEWLKENYPELLYYLEKKVTEEIQK